MYFSGAKIIKFLRFIKNTVFFCSYSVKKRIETVSRFGRLEKLEISSTFAKNFKRNHETYFDGLRGIFIFESIN